MTSQLSVGRLCDRFAEVIGVDAVTVRRYARMLQKNGYIRPTAQKATEFDAANLMTAWLAAPNSADVLEAMTWATKLRAVSALFIEDNATHWVDYEKPMSEVFPPGCPNVTLIEALADFLRHYRPGVTRSTRYVRNIIAGQYESNPTVWVEIADAEAGVSPGVVFSGGSPITELRAGHLVMAIAACRDGTAGVRSLGSSAILAIAEAFGPVPTERATKEEPQSA